MSKALPKGRRGRVTAASKLPVAREILAAESFLKGVEMLTLQQILNSQSTLLEGKRVKIVRHKETRTQYREEYRLALKNKSALHGYQRHQGRDVFSDCEYIISFVGLERSHSLFFGVFQVKGCEQRAREGGKAGYWYDLEQVNAFNTLVDRLVIDWGDSARAWVQLYHKQSKAVVEILPQGYVGTFPGLLDFVLEFDELKKLTENSEANHEWKHHLSAVNGIYLILDSSTGKQYIGSAYGDQGIWGRWGFYATSHHGGNVELKKLMEADPEHYRHFRFSVLQTLPSNTSARESIEVENLYKQKLGSLAHGLNMN